MKFRTKIIYLDKYEVGKRYTCNMSGLSFLILERKDVKDWLGHSCFTNPEVLLARSNYDCGVVWINSCFLGDEAK